MPALPGSGAFRLAMVQMRVRGGGAAENLGRAADRIAEAARQGAQVIVLPEALGAGWTDPRAARLAEPVPEGAPYRQLAACARQHGVFVCAGLEEAAAGQVFNTAILIGPEGELLLHHRKINELEIGHSLYGLGDRLHVKRTPLATFGVMICADAFAPGQVISRTLGMMGAEVILSPCAWAVPADHDPEREPYGGLWQDNYGPVARDFRLWIAGVSCVGEIEAGPWAGRRCIGCSLLVGPDGREVLKGPYGADADSILYAEIRPAPRPAQGDGWSRWWEDEAPTPSRS